MNYVIIIIVFTVLGFAFGALIYFIDWKSVHIRINSKIVISTSQCIKLSDIGSKSIL